MGGSVVVGEGAKILHRPHLNDGHQKNRQARRRSPPPTSTRRRVGRARHRQPERDDRRYRRKSGLIKPEEQGRQEPRYAVGYSRLEDLQPPAPEAKDARAQAIPGKEPHPVPPRRALVRLHPRPS
jgi:hypothetical protein